MHYMDQYVDSEDTTPTRRYTYKCMATTFNPHFLHHPICKYLDTPSTHTHCCLHICAYHRILIFTIVGHHFTFFISIAHSAWLYVHTSCLCTVSLMHILISVNDHSFHSSKNDSPFRIPFIIMESILGHTRHHRSHTLSSEFGYFRFTFH